ncbi:Arylsulfatase [Rubripirellula tenax]|uniref:Arylsulfatase n=1 Tax=Rubripirellula tenax TaxID=2528015 RepID=A0A5C6EC03_9BACT|nr:arylsulfatase [Rubripirellula tenax]TWU47313.1 Arylsulfatase [Rubripirellula tenax]
MSQFHAKFTHLSRMALIPFIACIAFFLQACLATPVQAASNDCPNIVLILADDLGFSDLGCYGGEIDTPNLDRLAARGVRFTQFYNTSRCWPTRAAMLTGYYAQQVRRDVLPGVKGRGQGDRPHWAPLLPEILASAGYRSHHSGKWHIDGEPIESGFERTYYLRDLGRLFRPRTHSIDGDAIAPVTSDDDYYATSFIADRTIEFLQDHQAKFADQPFLSYVAFSVPHFPLQASPADIAKYKGRYDRGWDVMREERFAKLKRELKIPASLSPLESDIGPPYHFDNVRETFGDKEIEREIAWDELTTEQQEFQSMKMEIHAAMVDRMDHEIGRILEQVDAMGATDNTMVIFLSDNGASAELMVRGDGHDPQAANGSAETHLCLGPGFSRAANTPFRRHKTWVHEGGSATPLIVSWPANILDGGGLRDQVGHVIDLVPTIVEAATGKAPQSVTDDAPPLPGKSLLPAMTGNQDIQRDYLWWLHDGHRALRVGDFKIVSSEGHPWELYDLSLDRSECSDLAADQPGRLAAMIETWQRHADETAKVVSAINSTSKSGK